MEQVRLGKSGLRVSRIILGMMSYGDPTWRPWVLDLEASRPFVQAALEAGVTTFDTADMYSLGRSEEVTRDTVLGMVDDREDVVIATKCFYGTGDPARRDTPASNRAGLSRKAIVAACDASLRRLGTDYIDLYQIHRWDPAVPIEETMAALQHLVDTGKVRYLGASSMHAWQFAKAQRVAALNGWTEFVAMQPHLNLLYREEEREMLPQCLDQGVGVIPWSPLARGRLARPANDQDTARADSDSFTPYLYDTAAHEVVEAVGRVAQRHGVSRAQVSLAWVLAQPAVTAPIVGATKLTHLTDAVASLDVTLSDEDLAELEGPYLPRPVLGHT